MRYKEGRSLVGRFINTSVKLLASAYTSGIVTIGNICCATIVAIVHKEIYMPPKVKFQKEEIIEAAVNITREKGVTAVTAAFVDECFLCFFGDGTI